MRKHFVLPVKAVLVLFLCGLLFLTCKKEAPVGENAASAVDKDTSYAFGMLVASQVGLTQMDLHLDYNAFMEGFRDFSEARETRLSQEQAMEKVSAVITKVQSQQEEEMWLEGEKNLEAGEAYLTENGARSGVTTTASGLQYEVLAEGSGEKPALTDKVRVHYEGTLIDGTVFDSSYQRGEPLEFSLNGVIRGWTEALQLMSVGSTYTLVIPPGLAYGANPPPGIPPNSVLIFKVELLSIVK